VPPDAPITWIGSPPDDEDARMVWQTVTREGVATYAALVDRVGERLFRRDLDSLGAVADIGFFQPSTWPTPAHSWPHSWHAAAHRRWGHLVSPLAFVAAIFATSVLAGGAGALLGLGGGILLIPVLTLVFGVDLHYAMGASIVSVIATSSGAAAAYLKTSLKQRPHGLFLALATVAGALVGAALAGMVPTRMLQLLLGVALAYRRWRRCDRFASS